VARLIHYAQRDADQAGEATENIGPVGAAVGAVSAAALAGGRLAGQGGSLQPRKHEIQMVKINKVWHS
jgi:hypothetical protein